MTIVKDILNSAFNSALCDKYKLKNKTITEDIKREICSLPFHAKYMMIHQESTFANMYKKHGVKVLNESFYKEDSDADDSARTIQKVDRGISAYNKYINLPFSILAGGMNAASMAAVSRPGDEAVGAAIGAGTGAVYLSVNYLFSKVVGFIFKKYAVACNNKVNEEEKRKCMLQAYNIIISRMRSELGKCKTTKNPDKCHKKLSSEIEHYTNKAQKYAK